MHSVPKLLEPGLPVCSRLAYEGLIQTENGYDKPGLLITELAERFPGRPIIFVRAGLEPSAALIEKLTVLLEQSDKPLALTLLSNADTRVNPFAGLQAPPGGLKMRSRRTCRAAGAGTRTYPALPGPIILSCCLPILSAGSRPKLQIVI